EEGVRRLLRDPARARRMGAAAREAALARYGLRRFLAEWDALLEEVATWRWRWSRSTRARSRCWAASTRAARTCTWRRWPAPSRGGARRSRCTRAATTRPCP